MSAGNVVTPPGSRYSGGSSGGYTPISESDDRSVAHALAVLAGRVRYPVAQADMDAATAVVLADYEHRETTWNGLPLVSSKDAMDFLRERLGVTEQQLEHLRQAVDARFPVPAGQINRRPVWWVSDLAPVVAALERAR